MNIALPIYFLVPVTGAQIIEAVRLTIRIGPMYPGGDMVKISSWDADAEAYIVGQRSEHPAYDIIIRIGEHFQKETVRPDGKYVSLVVANHTWPGIAWAVGYDDESIKVAVKGFHDRLIGVFSEILKVSVEDIVKKTDQCQGSGLSDIRFACPNCGSGLKENPGQCPHCGAPLGNLLPIY